MNQSTEIYLPDDIWYIILVKLYRSGQYNLTPFNKQSQRVIYRINQEREWIDIPWTDGTCEVWWNVGLTVIHRGYVKVFDYSLSPSNSCKE
jgi:hypothetical protein